VSSRQFIRASILQSNHAAEWLAAKYIATHAHDTEISGPLLLDWARRVFHQPISGTERDKKIQEIREYLSAA
jgi:hypothetical protein